MTTANARASDPLTSYQAADAIEKSGRAKAQRNQCLRMVFDRPGLTAAEIAVALGLERHAPSRRLPELRDAGLIRNGGNRICSVVKRNSMTWEPAKKKYEYAPDYAVAPGATLSEVIENLDMTQKDLATRTGLTEQTIVRILKGEQPITFETANRLELVTGVPARIWNNMEMQYSEQISKFETWEPE